MALFVFGVDPFIPSFFMQGELSLKEESQYHLLMELYMNCSDGTDELLQGSWRCRHREHTRGDTVGEGEGGAD